MWVKICGTTNLEDARLAVEAGADALGFIFAPSPRRISPKDARKIISELPLRIEKVGVFVNQAPEIILDTAETAGLTGVQLQGDEGADYVRELAKLSAIRKVALAVFKGISLKEAINSEPDDEFKECADTIHAMLFDSGSPSKRGGTGETFDWAATRLLVRRIAKSFKVVVAGGLRPDNVAEAIAVFQPWGVDVVSGVEREPGKKDPQKIKDFMTAVRKSAEKTHSCP